MNCIVNAKPMNKNSSPIIMTKEYTKQKIQGLQYIRSIPTITEQVSEIEAELTAIKQIKNKDPVKKAQIKDWIKVLTAEKKKILSNERKQNKALENMHDLFDENNQLKTELKSIKKKNKETVDKIKRLKTAQLIKYKKERDAAIKTLNQEKKITQKKIKENALFKKQQEEKSKKKEEKITMMKIKELQQKEKSASLIQKWYRKASDNKQRYSVRVILYRCFDLDNIDDVVKLCGKTDFYDMIVNLNKKYEINNKHAFETLGEAQKQAYNEEYNEIKQSSLDKVQEIHKRKKYKFFYKHIAKLYEDKKQRLKR